MKVNSVSLFLRYADRHPEKMALLNPGKKPGTFGDLLTSGEGVRRALEQGGVPPGGMVLLTALPGPGLFAAVVGALACGAGVVLVEPFMPVKKVEEVIRTVQPAAWLHDAVGFFWGVRVPAVRAIRRRRFLGAIRPRPAEREPLLVPEDYPGVLTFTSGTSGQPKGVMRAQGYLIRQHEILSDAMQTWHYTDSPDLTVFPNFVLSNLASGRGSVMVPSRWRDKDLRHLRELPAEHQPVTLTSGPAFLLHLMRAGGLPGLRSIHIGGALTDNAIFERAFACWPEAHFYHLYGSSEAEPVALADARTAVVASRERGYFQTLFLGKPVPAISSRTEPDRLWISGDHVCPAYVGNEAENRRAKRRDARGRLWHNMGDRIHSDERGWWYAGREFQPEEDFQLEQEIYCWLQKSKSFIQRLPSGKRLLIGEGIGHLEEDLRRRFPVLDGVRETPVIRDARHRARLDRKKMAARAGVAAPASQDVAPEPDGLRLNPLPEGGV